MAGGGELAAVFQARRVTRVVEKESSVSSGELAAIFQARKKINGGDDDDDDGNTTTTAAESPLSPSSVVGPTPKAKAGAATFAKFPLPSLPSPTATTATATATPADTSASVIRNKTLTKKFESRDLEVGIPTPGFLQDVRKNLKKPGEKKVVVNNPADAGGGGGGSSVEKKAKQTITVQVQEQRDEGEGGLASSISSAKNSSSTSRDPSHQDLMAARRSRMVASRSATSSNNSVGGGTPNNKTTINISVNTSTSLVGIPTLNQRSAPVTPASARREKLRARVRASSSSYLKPTFQSSSQSFNISGQDNLQTDYSDETSATGKIFISSPKGDEFEMSFFDAKHPGPIPDFDINNGNDQYQQKKQLIQQTQPHFELRTDSVDSIYKDLHTTSTGSTHKTANISSSLSHVDDAIGFRDHNASTPQISGSQRSVYDEEEADETKFAMAGEQTTTLSRPGEIHRRESSYGSTDQYNHLQPYALTRSPSQGSQMSAITTPSCFPQESAFPSISMSNNWAHEKPILEVDSFGNSASGSTKNSGNDETIRMREQMKEFKKKLEEKDAIISQLMKRISDLEQGNSFGKVAIGGYQQQQPPPRKSSFSTEGSASAFSTPNPVTFSPKITVSKGGRQTRDIIKRKSFNNSSSQSVQSMTSTDRKKFAC